MAINTRRERQNIARADIAVGRSYTDNIGAAVRRVESVAFGRVTYSRPGAHKVLPLVTVRLTTFAHWAQREVEDDNDD